MATVQDLTDGRPAAWERSWCAAVAGNAVTRSWTETDHKSHLTTHDGGAGANKAQSCNVADRNAAFRAGGPAARA
ncbi:hypothetical protein [Ensifer aridi]|uniref:hypothetical protein n=1 Tax=Ensifer aridi TaxID=1708715 RepID=UPI000427C8B3|nr:hypothetical protein [Ensifer aridi]